MSNNTTFGSPSRADAMTGHGYFSTNDTPGNKTYPMQRGFPYDELDLRPEEDEELNIDDEELGGRIDRKTLRDYVPSDRTSMHVRDRRAMQGQDSLGIPGFIAQESLIRLRSKTSEPSIGTMYGWSSQPMWNEPRRIGGVESPRYSDVIKGDDEEEFEDREAFFRLDALEERVMRKYVRTILRYCNY